MANFLKQLWKSFASTNTSPIKYVAPPTATADPSSESAPEIREKKSAGYSITFNPRSSGLSAVRPDISFLPTLEAPLQRDALERWFASVSAVSPSPENNVIIEMTDINNGRQSFEHIFEVYDTEQTTFCDVCGDSIWGSMMSVRCRYCNFTCHNNCSTVNAVKCFGREPSQIEDMRQSVGGDAVTLAKKASPKNCRSSSVLNDTIASSLHYENSSTYDFREPLYLRHIREVDRVKREELSGSQSLSKDKELLSETENSRSNTIASMAYDLTTLDKAQLLLHGVQLLEIDTIDGGDDVLSPVLCRPPFSKRGVHFADGATIWTWKELNRRIRIFHGNCNDMVIEKVILPYKQKITEVSGSLKIYINFIRPVKVLQAMDEEKCYPTLLDLRCYPTDATNGVMDNFETQFIPRGAPKLVYVKLEMTAQQAISAVLKKFNIFDNPKKFAIYEHTIHSESEVSVRRLKSNECPLLLLFTYAGRSVTEFNRTLLYKRLVLQENETGDIDWDAFSFYELKNFLTILQREEDQHRRQIEEVYSLRRKYILRLL